MQSEASDFDRRQHLHPKLDAYRDNHRAIDRKQQQTGMAARRRRSGGDPGLVDCSRRRRWPVLVAILAIGGFIGIVGCGGGFGGTTPGAYSITVSGASGSLNATIATINLTVVQ